MIVGQIDCSNPKCQRVIESTADSVSLPFFCCSECQEEAEAVEAAEFQKDIAPTIIKNVDRVEIGPGPIVNVVTRKDEGHETCCGSASIENTGLGEASVASFDGQQHDTVCETATVEATTELIADLDKQVEQLTDSLNDSNQLIVDLSKQLRGANAEYTKLYAEARGFEKAFNRAMERIQVQKGTIQTWFRRVREILTQKRQLESEVNRYRYRLQAMYDELDYYKSRGFFRRLFNVKYSG